MGWEIGALLGGATSPGLFECDNFVLNLFTTFGLVVLNLGHGMVDSYIFVTQITK